MAKKRTKAKTKNRTKKKKTIRETHQFPALNKRFFSKVKQEFHDIDYVHLLNEKEKSILNSFLEETLGARFNHEGKKIYKSKAKKLEIFNQNNARQRDIYSIAKSSGKFADVDVDQALELWESRYTNHDYEPVVQEENDMLSLREYKALLNSGAYVPMEVLAFYDELFNIVEKSCDSGDKPKKSKNS